MAPPKFADLSKSVKDLFNDDFGFGATKLTLKSKSTTGATFKVEGTRSDSGAVNASLETKLAHSGINIKEKFTTKNDILTELSTDVHGTKVTAETTFNPGAGFRDFKIKSDYSKDHVTATVSANNKGVLSTSSVFGFAGKYLLGASADYDTGKATLSSNSVAIGFTSDDLTVTSSITNGSDIETALYHVPKPNVQAGLKFTWSKASSDVGFDLVGKYNLDAESFVKVKLDRALNIGLSYTQPIRKGVSFTLAANVRGGALQSDQHQLGFALSLE